MSIKIQKNISLSKYTSFKIGGAARFFCVAENSEEIKGALKFAEENKLPIFILGGGSNLLVSDKGFGGLVIKIQSSKLKVLNNEIFAGAGLPLAKLVNESVKNNLTGMEWAAGIPGTVGGAIVNNAGAFGKRMGDIVESVEILEYKTPPLKKSLSRIYYGRVGGIPGMNIKKLNNKQCQFSYRNSIFKQEKKYIIISAILKLKRGNKTKSRKIILENLKSRKDKQPLQYPSAGSVFKNPSVEKKCLNEFRKRYPELKKASKEGVIPAGWFIENLDLKEKKIGGAMVSEKHGNFIINTGNAKAEDVVILISLIKQKARDRFGVQLKEEIEYVGF